MLGITEIYEEVQSWDFTSGLEAHFETLLPETVIGRERSESFIDLLNQPLGLPEVDSMYYSTAFDQLALEAEEIPLPEISSSTSITTMVSQADLLTELYLDTTNRPITKKKKFPVKPKVHLVPISQQSINPNSMVGTITLEERRKKISKYLEKRKRRTFCKRISYECRKRVADKRLRVKGRFVTKEQASQFNDMNSSGSD